MSLVTDIASIITTLYPDATYILSSKFQANQASFAVETTALPLIILDNELIKEAEIKINNNILKDTRIVISVLNLDTPNNTDLQSEAIREACEIIADRIAVNIYQLTPVLPATRQKYKLTPAFHVYNTDLTGVILDMKIMYNEVILFCNV
jgi:hypothetical protein